MNFVAIKMLVGDRAKYLGILMGLTFSSFLITEQMAIFTGLMTRPFRFFIAEIYLYKVSYAKERGLCVTPYKTKAF